MASTHKDLVGLGLEGVGEVFFRNVESKKKKKRIWGLDGGSVLDQSQGYLPFARQPIRPFNHRAAESRLIQTEDQRMRGCSTKRE